MNDKKTTIDNTNTETTPIAQASQRLRDQGDQRPVSIIEAIARSCARSICDREDESYGIRSKP